MKEKSEKETILPLFSLKEVVLFPGMNLPLHIFEDKYKKLISYCIENKKHFGIVYSRGNLCAEVGTTAHIIDTEKLEDGKMNILTEGKSRFKIVRFVNEVPYHEALITSYEDRETDPSENIERKISEIRKLSQEALKIFDEISDQELSKKIALPSDNNELIFLVAANLECSYEAKQTILESRSLKDRSKKVLKLLKEEIKRLEIMRENKETKEHVTKNGKLKI